MTDVPPRKPTPKMDAIERLFGVVTVEQLEQLTCLLLQARAASALVGNGVPGAGVDTDVKIRFKGGRLRFMGVSLWEVADK